MHENDDNRSVFYKYKFHICYAFVPKNYDVFFLNVAFTITIMLLSIDDDDEEV
ncbi:hypothetical protein FORC83_p016 (plasmid) [Campylobacter jejuni]|nr:hypothetical protein FORC83_p016 [Campylobacter jejuni]